MHMSSSANVCEVYRFNPMSGAVVAPFETTLGGRFCLGLAVYIEIMGAQRFLAFIRLTFDGLGRTRDSGALPCLLITKRILRFGVLCPSLAQTQRPEEEGDSEQVE